MSAVADLLRGVAAYGLPTERDRFPTRPLGDSAWRELTSHVRWQRVTHLLARSVTRGAMPATDAQVDDAIRTDEEAIVTALRLERMLLDVATLLDREGVPFRVLKGPAVAHLDYPEPVWRGFGDIDLLIRPDDLDQVIQLLSERGFSRRFPQPRAGFDRRFTKSVSLTSPDGDEVDLHRTLTVGGYGYRIDVRTLWELPGSTFRLGTSQLTALGREERFLHACYHAVLGNVPPRLSPLRDIAQILINGDVDSDRTLMLAEAWRGTAVLAHAVATTQRTLSVQLNDQLSEWAAAFVAPPKDRRELARATSPGYTFTAQALDVLRAIRGTRQRAAYLFALAFPHRSYVQGRHSGFTARARHALSEIHRTKESSRD